MNQAVDEFNRAKSRMASTFDKAMAETEELRKAAADVPGGGAAAVPTKSEEKAGSIRVSLSGAFQPAFDRARETAAAAEDYVQASPWVAIGIAAAAGVLIGFLAARR
jgi:ElaB/YqjD/DUF883 family membrane-anchored ribosome-binding protein